MSKKYSKKFFLYSTAAVIVLFVFGLIWFLSFRSKSAPVIPAVSPVAVQFHSQLDGSAVTTAEQTMPLVVGVMIDNHPDARPPAGITLARVVYEAPVEGGFTRYFALFSSGQTVGKAGPVRSARLYFLDWLAEYGTPVYMHSGGSSDALAEIKRRGIFSVNEFYWGEYYWRSDEADPPHNLFTKSNLWQALLEKFGDRYATTTWSGWVFGDAPSAASSTVKAVAVKYTADYTVGWRYELDSKKYRRFINGQLSSDRAGRPVLADNIIILEMPVRVLDEEGRKAIATIGAGSARVVRQGTLVRGTWKKSAVESRTRVYDASGQEITLVPGITWVEVIPPLTTVEITQ